MRKLYFKIHTVQRNSSPIDSNTHVKEYQFSLSAGRKCHKHSMLMYDNTILVKMAINDPKKSAIILVFTLFLCGWSRKLAPTSQPIQRKTRKRESLIGRLRFPALQALPLVFTSSPYWLVMMSIFVPGLSLRFCDTRSKRTLWRTQAIEVNLVSFVLFSC